MKSQIQSQRHIQGFQPQRTGCCSQVIANMNDMIFDLYWMVTCVKTENFFTSKPMSMSVSIRTATSNLWSVFLPAIHDHGQLKERWLRQWTTENGHMAIETRNTDIVGTTTDGMEIPTPNLRFLTTVRSIKLCPSNFHNDRHMEMKLSRLDTNLAISGCPLLSQSLADTFTKLVT